MLVPAVPGLGLGLLVVTTLAKEPLQVGVGLAVVAAAAWSLRSHEPLPVPVIGAGFVSGVLTTSIGVNGPPLALWLESERVPPQVFRTTLAAAFLVLDAAGILLIVSSEGTDAVDLGVLGPLLAGVMAGYAVGALAFRRLDAALFSRVALVVIICTGIASVAAGIL
jgi:uncharacterized protein